MFLVVKKLKIVLWLKIFSSQKIVLVILWKF